MLAKAPDQNQLDCFNATLKQIINPKHPLVTLADNIPGKSLEVKFETSMLTQAPLAIIEEK